MEDVHLMTDILCLYTSILDYNGSFLYGDFTEMNENVE